MVLDWAAGFVADTECADTLQVIEFANVQLLEFRHIDDRLDDRLEAAYRLIRPERQPPLVNPALAPPRRRHPTGPRAGDRGHQPVRAGGQRPEADRRSLLVRVFELASTRFHLRDWQQSIRRKLETVGDVYDLLVQQAGGQRTEALEITVVVLIALRSSWRCSGIEGQSLNHFPDLTFGSALVLRRVFPVRRGSPGSAGLRPRRPADQRSPGSRRRPRSPGSRVSDPAVGATEGLPSGANRARPRSSPGGRSADLRPGTRAGSETRAQLDRTRRRDQ